MNVGIDSYCSHRYFGEIYEGLQADPGVRWRMESEFLDFSLAQDVGEIALEACFFDALDDGLCAEIRTRLDETGVDRVLGWGRPEGLWGGTRAEELENLNVLSLYRHGSGGVSGFAHVIACEADHPLAAEWWPSGHVLGWEHSHINMLAHFLRAVADGDEVSPFGATFYDGLRVAQIAGAAREAAGSREWVPVAKALGAV